jgi:hypothetical protein
MNVLFRTLALLGAVASANAGAAVVEYTDRSAFLALLQPGYFSEDFSALDAGDQEATSLAFSGGSPPIGVTIETRNQADDFAGDNLWVAGTGTIDKGLGTSTSLTDRLRITGPNFFAIGGEWFLGDVDDDHVPGIVTLAFSDGSTAAVSSSLEEQAFRGYISDSPLTGLLISGPGTAYVTIDNLVVGTPVPLPSAAGLFVAGLAAVLRRRRSARSGLG